MQSTVSGQNQTLVQIAVKLLMSIKQEPQVSAEESTKIVDQFYVTSNSTDMDTEINALVPRSG